MRIQCGQLILFTLLAAFSGCQKQGDKSDLKRGEACALSAGVHYGEGHEVLAKLPLDAVLLRVNGFSFTRKDFELEQDVYCKLMSLLNLGKVDCDSKDAEKLKAMRAPKVLNTVLRRELLNQEAKRRNVKASDAAISARRNEIEQLFNSKGAWKDRHAEIETLAKQMGDECCQYFLENLKKDSENLELSWQMGGDRISVSEDDVTAGSNRLAKANAFTMSTNGVLEARLMTALNRVRSGEDFAAVGLELSMFDKDESKVWGTFSVDDFEDTDYPGIAKFLDTKPASGSVAGPFQCDDGMSIVKVLEVVQGSNGGDTDAGEKEDPEDGKCSVRYKLARISVETFELHPSLSRTEIRKILEDDKRKKFEAEFGRQLFERAVIEFPSGTNLFAAASSDRARGSDSTKTEH